MREREPGVKSVNQVTPTGREEQQASVAAHAGHTSKGAAVCQKIADLQATLFPLQS